MREWITELSKNLFSDSMSLFKLMKGKDDFSYFINNKAKLIHSYEYKHYYRFAG